MTDWFAEESWSVEVAKFVTFPGSLLGIHTSSLPMAQVVSEGRKG